MCPGSGWSDECFSFAFFAASRDPLVFTRRREGAKKAPTFNIPSSIHRSSVTVPRYNPCVRILGIDPGSVTTGFGVIEQVRGRLALIEQGTIGTTRGAELADRLCRIHDEIVAVIARNALDAVAVEAPFGGQNVKSLIQLAHARGVILL